MRDVMPDLFARQWNVWTARLDVSQAVAQRWLADLEERYTEPQRHYHGRSHIVDLLEKLSPLTDRFEQLDETLAALYFHDAVYEIGKPDNEALSAGLVRRALPELGFTADATARVSAMIEATASHAATGVADTDLFIDLDMSILAAPRERYKTYAQGVMAEFAPVFSRSDYIAGRIAMFLQPTLNGERLFLTDHYRAQEAEARENMEWEIRWLGEGGE